MNFLEMLKKQSQQGGRTPPPSQNGRFDFAGSPFPSSPSAPQSNGLPQRNRSDLSMPNPAQSPAPAPAPAPAPQRPDMMGPQELMGPTRDLAGPMGMGAFEQQGPPISSEQLVDVSVPERERKSHFVDKPFHKDRDRMSMLLSGLSEGFGGMTLRGKSGMSAMNKATFADARKNIKNNKTFDYLAKNDPKMAKVMAGIPPEYRSNFMELYQKSLFSDKLGDENSTADIRNFKFRKNLSDEQKKLWDNQKTGEKLMTLPDNSVIAVGRDGSHRIVLSSEDALAMTAAGADAEQGGKASGDEFRTMYKAARYTQDNLDGLMQTRNRLVNSKDGGGIFQPVELFMDRVKAEFGDIEGAANATNEQLLQMEGIERTMQWFLDSGLGARGLDTPAEFMQWLKLNGGDLTMTREASIEFIDKALDRTMRNADRFNDARTDPLYSDVDKIDRYKPVEYADPRALTPEPTQQQATTVTEGSTQVIDGATYVYRNGQWYPL